VEQYGNHGATLLESILIFGFAGLILQIHVIHIIVYVAVYTLFSFLLLGINYLSMRFTGTDLSAGALILIYYLAVVLTMLPGVILAVIIGVAVGEDAGYLTGALVLSGWELAAGLVCFALSKGVLHDCDMGMMKQNR
jgi:uncharacterized membrane protein YjgN (DUF898 family)